MRLITCPNCGTDGWTKYEIKNGICPNCNDGVCPDCGEEMEWEDCYICGGEGGRDWDELQFEDPLWYSPEDFVDCDTCNGEGGFWVCDNCK